jgi:hypothetical protein
MPLLETKGAGSAQGFGLSLGSAEPVYIEQTFSTYLYTGNGGTQTITNGIDLDGEGGLVWIKDRSAASQHEIFDTVRGLTQAIHSETTAQQFATGDITSANSNGWTMSNANARINANTITYVSWTFRKQPKFFDIVTYTGDGSANKSISHSLGSTPGTIIVKSTSATGDWPVFHRSLTAGNSLYLNSTVAQGANADWGNPYTAPTSTTFNVSYSNTNASGVTYVAYLFAHDAGGFGLEGTDNVISCGSYTGTGVDGNAINLGYEPQWLLVKRATGSAEPWLLSDTMRELSMTTSRSLRPNSSAAEVNDGVFQPSSTGFVVNYGSGNSNASGATYIYIAIRRGPMEVPTVGTSVFTPISRTGTGANATIASGFTTDLQIVKSTSQPYNNAWFDRLRGTGIALFSNSTVADQNYGAALNFQSNTAVNISSETLINQSGETFANFSFQRAPGFFDEVCYTGLAEFVGVSGFDARSVTHNLTVAPEFLIVKSRSSGNWFCYLAALGNGNRVFLNTTDASSGNIAWNQFTPTSTTFQVNAAAGVNTTGTNYVAYLFATCAGVSKVGSYTGTGTTLQINCGFTGGARFVLIKRTDSTGDWYVWDSARGIVAGNDPYLLLNSTAAEVTNTDYVDTYSLGFEISSTAPAAINASGGSFIFLAIA